MRKKEKLFNEQDIDINTSKNEEKIDYETKNNIFDTEVANSIMKYCPSNKNDESKCGIERSNLSIEIIINSLEKEFNIYKNNDNEISYKLDLNKKLKNLQIQSNDKKAKSPIKVVNCNNYNNKANLRTNNANAQILNSPYVQTTATITSRDNSKRPIVKEESKFLYGSNTSLKTNKKFHPTESNLKNMKIINNYQNIIVPEATHVSINNNYYNYGSGTLQKTLVISDYRTKSISKQNSTRDRNRNNQPIENLKVKEDFLTLRSSNSNIAYLLNSKSSKSEFASPKVEKRKAEDNKSNYNKILNIVSNQKSKDKLLNQRKQSERVFNTIDKDFNSIKNKKYISLKQTNNEIKTERSIVNFKDSLKSSVINFLTLNYIV